ncbi:hypothetical protein PIB30_012405, partial [Stylosanthes scabra]|nr:hypothetical protein [Stylosanthes scabra]
MSTSNSDEGLQVHLASQYTTEASNWLQKKTLAHSQSTMIIKNFDERERGKRMREQKSADTGTEKRMTWVMRERRHICSRRGVLLDDGDRDFIVEVW